MQTDRRLIEDVKHIHELRADLSSQSDTLALSSRKRSRSAVKGQIVQAHIQKECGPVLELFQYISSNDALSVC